MFTVRMLEDALAEFQIVVNDAATYMLELQGRHHEAQETIKSLEIRIESLEQDLEDALDRCDTLEEELAEARSSKEEETT